MDQAHTCYGRICKMLGREGVEWGSQNIAVQPKEMESLLGMKIINFSQPHGNLIVWETWKFHKNLNQELHKYQLKSSTLFVKGSIYEERMSG